MGVIATAVKLLIAAGVSGDDLVNAISEMEIEAEIARQEARDICHPDHQNSRTANAERQARWRARQKELQNETERYESVTEALRSVTNNVTRNAPSPPLIPPLDKENPPTPPKEIKPPPISPPLPIYQASPDSPSGDEGELKPIHVMERWNDVAAALGKPKIKQLTESRRALIKSRIAQYQLEDFLTVFAKIQSSPFLRGDTGWRGCNFDWVFKRANFQKILEGNYDA